MNARFGLILAFAALLSGSGCAAGGSSGEPAATPPPGVEGTVLAEGISPRDNSFTEEAEEYINQAMNAEEEATKEDLYRQALEAARQGIAQDPENPKSYFQGAVANVNLGNYFAADSMFTRAEELHPRYILETEPWRERGWVNAYNEAIVPLNAGDLETALEIFEGADALYSERPEALLQMGSAYSRLGRNEEAAQAFREALALLEESEEMAMMDSTEAETWVQHYDIASKGLGQALQLSEQYTEAAEVYGELLEKNPDDAQILGSLASVLTELEMPDSVDALYNRLLNRPGLTEFDYSNAGVGLYRIEQYDRAAQAFRAAADMNPFNRDARLNLTQTYYQAQDWESLIPAARELLEVDPLNGLVWVFLTRAYSELERTEEANAVFNEYQEIGYELENIMLDAQPSGGATVSGTLKNNTGEPGETVTLRFHFGGTEGEGVGTTEIQIQLPAPEETVEFFGEFVSPEIVTGYKYEVVN